MTFTVHRPHPVRDRLIRLLRETPSGLSTRQIADQIGQPIHRVGSYLCRAALWGQIKKSARRSTDTRNAHEWNVWSLPDA